MCSPHSLSLFASDAPNVTQEVRQLKAWALGLGPLGKHCARAGDGEGATRTTARVVISSGGFIVLFLTIAVALKALSQT